MKPIIYIQRIPSSGYDNHDLEQEGNENTEFADLIIDGRSLYQMLMKYDRIQICIITTRHFEFTE